MVTRKKFLLSFQQNTAKGFGYVEDYFKHGVGYLVDLPPSPEVRIPPLEELLEVRTESVEILGNLHEILKGRKP